MNKVIGIVGLGRFGTLLHAIISNDLPTIGINKGDSLSTLAHCTDVFLCVPIRTFKSTLIQLQPHLSPTCTILDTCSVKLYPTECMQAHLPNTHTLIATHPLFGPDSYMHENKHRMVMHSIQGDGSQYDFWKHYFTNKNIDLIEMTPDQHDDYMARSQALTHLIGRTLGQLDIQPTPVDTLGFERLISIKNQTCNDSEELFQDMLDYNPHTSSIIQALIKSMQQLS